MLVDFLRTNRDIFASKPLDMLGILREVTEHTLKIWLGPKLVKQCLCRFNEGKCRAISEEIVKLFGGQVHQGSIPPRVVSQSRSCTKEEWEIENVC